MEELLEKIRRTKEEKGVGVLRIMMGFIMMMSGGMKFLVLRRLLDLVPRGRGHPVVGHGGRLDHDRGAIERPEHRIAHLGGGAHVDAFDTGRCRQVDRTRHQDHLRPPAARLFGQRETHTPRRAVGQHTNGIDRLFGRLIAMMDSKTVFIRA